MEDSSGKKGGRSRGAPSCVHDRRRWKLGQSLWLQFASVTLYFFYQHHHLLPQTVATPRPWLSLYTKVYSHRPLPSESSLSSCHPSSFLSSSSSVSLIIPHSTPHRAGPQLLTARFSMALLHCLHVHCTACSDVLISSDAPRSVTTSTIGTL